MARTFKQIQQGDVLFQELESLPQAAAKIAHKGPIVVARGEKTGHSHVVDSDQVTLWQLTRGGETQTYLEVRAPAIVRHDEHKPLQIPTGIYRVGRVKEFDYFERMERPIED